MDNKKNKLSVEAGKDTTVEITVNVNKKSKDKKESGKDSKEMNLND